MKKLLLTLFVLLTFSSVAHADAYSRGHISRISANAWGLIVWLDSGPTDSRCPYMVIPSSQKVLVAVAMQTQTQGQYATIYTSSAYCTINQVAPDGY
jgi:uncharacterized protein YbjT (DUF2867 family)